jgi:hypothetical protein
VTAKVRSRVRIEFVWADRIRSILQEKITRERLRCSE